MEEKEKKDILGYLANLIWYFIIFSVIGLIVETLFGYATMGKLECRKGFIYGPFCPVYGAGAVLCIALLDRVKESKFKVFFYGMIAGAVIEYVISYMLEAIYGLKFWDYTYLPYNLNGRICVRYSSYWGILSLGLIYLVKPNIDKLINKIPKKNIIAIIACILLVIDAIITVVAINIYEERAKRIYYNEEPMKENVITETLFSNEYMKKTFPNIRLITDDGKIVFISEIIK